MKYVNLGRSGLKVSRLCLGCMSYGEPERLPQPWSLDEKASRPLIRQALEAGINFFDTANIYSGGSSEEITGKALREMARRDEIVVATKTFFPWRNSPNTGFLSRKAIFQSIDDSLMRLGMDYVDLFQIHRFDYSTPVEETMEALQLATINNSRCPGRIARLVDLRLRPLSRSGSTICPIGSPLRLKTMTRPWPEMATYTLPSLSTRAPSGAGPVN